MLYDSTQLHQRCSLPSPPVVSSGCNKDGVIQYIWPLCMGLKSLDEISIPLASNFGYPMSVLPMAPPHQCSSLPLCPVGGCSSPACLLLQRARSCSLPFLLTGMLAPALSRNPSAWTLLLIAKPTPRRLNYVLR